MAAAATARKPAASRGGAAPARKRSALRVAPAPKRKKASPAPRKAPARRPGGPLIPLAVGTATAVRHLPDSGLMVRMTRGRAWIGVLGVLLAGIVALNVVTLSLSATAGRIDQNIQALDRENSILRSRDAQRSGSARVRREAAPLGLAMASAEESDYLEAGRGDIATAARRLAASGAY